MLKNHPAWLLSAVRARAYSDDTLAKRRLRRQNAARHNDRNPALTVERILIEAIALQRLVAAVYDGNRLLLAPHQLLTRHGALFVSALNTGKTWRSDQERRLGPFKLDGLSELILTDAGFEPLAAPQMEPGRRGD